MTSFTTQLLRLASSTVERALWAGDHPVLGMGHIHWTYTLETEKASVRFFPENIAEGCLFSGVVWVRGDEERAVSSLGFNPEHDTETLVCPANIRIGPMTRFIFTEEVRHVNGIGSMALTHVGTGTRFMWQFSEAEAARGIYRVFSGRWQGCELLSVGEYNAAHAAVPYSKTGTTTVLAQGAPLYDDGHDEDPV
jgi:hypothetical protein